MDGAHFDNLARQLSQTSTRRFALGGMLAGLLLPLDNAARGKGKQRRRNGKDKKRASIQEEPCWRPGACIPSKGANVSRCDLTGYTTFPTSDCTGCNLSRTNLSGVSAHDVNFTRANLSSACLVDANFFDATFARNTNLANAIFCRTIMPDGSFNNSGCGSGSACCPTNCGASATCGANQYCCDGTCSNCPCGQDELSNGTCVTPCTDNSQCCGSCLEWQTNVRIRFCSTGALPLSCGTSGDNACPTGLFCTNTGFCTPACPPFQ